ncbi:MAG: hypothetical protein PHE51_11390, partial [Eubacteriales bacterium]|nr:hypothetical protein [Eubacteriales bacterium]
EILGCTPPVYAISEHALHSQLPQILSQVGYRQAIMRTHFMMYGYNPTIDASYCSWIGEDGSEIDTIPTYDGEGARFAKTTVDNWFLTRWPDNTDESPDDFESQFSHIEPLLASRYDDMDLRCDKMIEYTQGKDKYEWVLLEDLKDIYKDAVKVPFKTQANDFKVRMPWGYCGGSLMRLARLCENDAIIAERCNAFAYMLTGKTETEGLTNAWKKALIVQHHDLQICGLISETEGFANESLDLSKRVISSSIDIIRNAFNREYDNNIIVINPLDREVQIPIKANIHFGLKNGGLGFVAVCADERIPCELDYERQRRKKCTGGNIYFTATLKPFSAKCYGIVADDNIQLTPTENTNSHIETDNYIIDLDDNGIKSIYYKKGNRYITKSDTGMLFKGIIDEKESISTGKWFVYSHASFVECVQIGNIGDITYKFTMNIHNCTDRIECKVCFDHHGEKIGSSGEFEFLDDTNGFIHENKLRFILPLMSDGQGVRDLPFVISDTDEKYIQGNYWTGIKGEFAYLNMGSMCSVKEDGHLSLPLEYSNDYIWGKRILFGEYTHDFAIVPFESNNQVHQSAYEYNHKPIIKYATAGNGEYKDEIVFVNIESSDNILTTALYTENEKILIRMYETDGKVGYANITSDFAKVKGISNLQGEKVQDSEGEITINPKEITTMILK